MSLDPQPVAPSAKGHSQLVRLYKYWYVACESAELGEAPLARTILGIPMALFRTRGGRVGAFADRCPHRNAPLSIGRVEGELLQCRYHGWRFETSGRCVAIPALCDDSEAKARNATAFPAVEQQGFVWVYASAGAEPHDGPPRFPHLGDAGYTSVRRQFTVESSLLAAAENALDVPHTSFLHQGLFRSEPRGLEITAVVRASADRVEAEYVGEPRPTGLAARILSPSGGMVTHFDRFLLPSITEVEYRLGEENHFISSGAHTPVSDTLTRLFAVITFRLRLPGWLVRPALTPVAMRIFRQDAEILRQQTSNIERFGGEQFASTEVDVLGPRILRLLKAAERGDPESAASADAPRVRLRV